MVLFLGSYVFYWMVLFFGLFDGWVVEVKKFDIFVFFFEFEKGFYFGCFNDGWCCLESVEFVG